MIQTEVYHRIELIDRILRNTKDTLSDYMLDLLYDELEILCDVIVKSRQAMKI